jgi:hypothetical protein
MKINTEIANSMELSFPWEATSCAAIEQLTNTFMEPGGLLPCSQEPFICLNREPDQSSPYQPVPSP